MTAQIDDLVNTLHATAPFAPLSDRLDLFGRFVGAWDLDWHGQDHHGNDIVVRGELHVGWILNGRAVQDVWQVPTDPADAARMRSFHGTTVRFYDPTIDAWRSTWIDPINGRVRRFIGRSFQDDIVLMGIDKDPQERWSFLNITAESFHWLGETTLDGGHTWAVSDKMFAHRRDMSGR